MSLDNIMQKKALVWSFNKKISTSSQLNIGNLAKGYLHEDILFRGPHPINDLNGQGQVIQNFWKPFIEAFPNFERHHDIFLGGSYKGDSWVSSMGHYVAKFEKPWLGIPASNKLVTIRFGEFCKIQDGKIKEIYLLMDLLDLMRQVSLWPLPYTLGVEGWWPKPFTLDGIVTKTPDVSVSRDTTKLISRWTEALNDFESTVVNFDALKLDEYFDPLTMRYGASGLGACRGIQGIKDNHYSPLINAFQERKIANHQFKITEGTYLSACGWENIKGRHVMEIFGVAATNKLIKVRAMEWWRQSGNLIRESWIMPDMVDLLLQLDVDVFAKMHDAQETNQWL